MHRKLFEIRDKCTFIPAMGFLVHGADSWLIRSAGYSGEYPTLMVMKLGEPKVHFDPYHWSSRTMRVAHEYIAEHWAELEDGAIIDVQFILGERKEAAKSEQGYYTGIDAGIVNEE